MAQFFCVSSAKSATLLWRAEHMPKTLSKQIFLLWRAVKNKNKCFFFFLLLGFIYNAPWSSPAPCRVAFVIEWELNLFLSSPFFFQQSWCVDFHNAMLIYVQTIASNFSRAVSPLCRAPLWIIVGNEYSCRRDYKPGSLFRNIYIYIKGAVCDTWVFIITADDKIRSVTCILGLLSPVSHYALPC